MNPSSSFTLANAPLRRPVRIREIQSHPDVCVRLRELGFCENAVIRCLNKGNGNVICEVCNTRLGINNLLASTISVFTF
ncbi:MAG: Ferrous iron transport protein [Bacteroidetes bacterium]|nr:Ferrous iron transport protein [Bacteroidota bacterium]